MSSTQSHPEGEIDPPADSTVPVEEHTPAEAYSPEQARRRREYSVWDPRSAPGTYLLLAINIRRLPVDVHPRRRLEQSA